MVRGAWRGKRSLVGLALALLASGGTAIGSARQGDAQEEPRFEHYRGLHLEGVRREREELVRELWLEAPAERREAALRAFERGRHPLARPFDPPSLRALAEGRRSALGESDGTGPLAWQAQLAEALDLRVVPGAFEARVDGLGDPLTVFVRPVFPVQAAQEVVLRLFWRSAEGAEERARSEEIPPEAFAAEGFEMYVRAPFGPPSTWRLVPEIEHAGRTWRGPGVAIDGVRELRAREARLASAVLRGEVSPLARALSDQLALRLDLGLRDGIELGLGRWIEMAEGGEGAARTGEPELVFLPGFEGSGAHVWSLAPASGAREGPTILIATGGREHPLEQLSGALGRQWASVQQSLGAVLLATDLPVLAMESGPTLLDLVAHLGAAEGSELVLVARGESAVLLPARLREAGARGIARLVLCGAQHGEERPRPKVALPLLVLTSAAHAPAAESGEDEGHPWRWVRRREPGFLADLAAPAEIGAWLAERAQRAAR